MHEATRVLGSFLRDTMRANPSTFRLFGPDGDVVEPVAERVRGDGSGLGMPNCGPATITSPPTGA